MKTLYVHIGTPKTGTTSIQAWMEKNRGALSRKGFYYPKSFRDYDYVNPRRNGHFLIGNPKNGSVSEEDTTILYDGLKYVTAFFNEYDNIILSDESILKASYSYRADLWDILLENASQNNYTVKVIVYLRRQDLYLASRYNQLVKKGEISSNFPDFVHMLQTSPVDILDYEKQIRRLASYFSGDNLIVKRFSRDAFYQGDLIADFLQIIGATYDEDFAVPAADSNVSLPDNLAEIKRIANSLPNITSAEKAFFRDMMFSCRKHCEHDYPCRPFSPDEAQDLLDQYRDGNERIAAEFIRDGKPMFDYAVDNLPKYSLNNPYMTEDMIWLFTTSILALYRENAALEKKLNEGLRLQNKLKEMAHHPISTSKEVFPKIYRKYLKK